MLCHYRGLPRGLQPIVAGLLIVSITAALGFMWVSEDRRAESDKDHAGLSPSGGWINSWLKGDADASRGCTDAPAPAPVTVLQTVTVTVPAKPDTTAAGKIKFPAGVFKAYDEDYSSLLTESDLPVLAALRNYTLNPPSPSHLPVLTSYVHSRKHLLDQFYLIGAPTGPSSWSAYLESLDPAHLAPLTHIAQHYIHTHQHPSPSACKTSRFLVLPSFHRGSGLGSILHGATHALSSAIRSGHVLIYDQRPGDGERSGSPGMLFSGNGEFCPDGKPGMDCFFAPITNCSWADVRLPPAKGEPEGTAEGEEAPNAILFRPYDPNGNKKAVHPKLGYGTRYGDIPPVLGKLLQEWEEMESGGTGVAMSPNARKLWWRAQGAGYLARLNPWAMAKIRENRLGGTLVRVGVRGNKTDIPMPFPLPASTFSIHVRHGDKATEMDLVPFSAYLRSAASIADDNPSRGLPSKTVFLSTEDPAVITEMLEFASHDSSDSSDTTTSNLQWTFFYTQNLPRNNGGPKSEVVGGGEVETTLMHLGELLVGVEAGGWVGTRASNWCRLVEELAQVWVGGSAGSGQAPGGFVEVGGRGDWVDYHF